MNLSILSLSTILLLLIPSALRAETSEIADSPQSRRTSDSMAAELNVLWPFFPGGYTDVRILIPTAARGQVVLGPHADFSQRRRLDKGKVNITALRLGYRQYLWKDLHLEVSANLGRRYEHQRPSTGENHTDFVILSWAFAGYQLDLGKYFYVNARGGIGHLSYASDTWPGQSEGIFGAGDINIGVYF